jgi:hypothetical protein
MRAALIALALIATPAVAQQSNWWGGTHSGTGYPTNSTPITATATATTGAMQATLPGVVGKTTFICGFSLTSVGSTTPNASTATVTGTISGSLNFAYSAGNSTLVVNFAAICIPASAQNTAIIVGQPAGGAGTLDAAVSAWGYQL